MRKSIALGTFAALAAGSMGAGALDAVPGMRGSDTLKDLTNTILSQCADLATYPTNPPIVYDGTGSSNGENQLKNSVQWIAPMSRALGTGICDSSAPRAGAEGMVIALDALSIVTEQSVGSVGGAAFSVDYPGTAGVPGNAWRTVLREVYAGMGASGSNVFLRDCNSAARRALVDNWDNLFKDDVADATCADSHPSFSSGTPSTSYDPLNAIVEPGLRHAFRRDEESGTTDVFLAQLSLPSLNFQQTGTSSSVIPAGSSTVQAAVYRALANSPFCNIRRPDDDHQPVTLPAAGGQNSSQIPAMANIGVLPATAGTGLSLVPHDPNLSVNARQLSPYMIEQMDQDPIRRRCIGRTNSIAAGLPIEQVCGADGRMGVVLPINPPPVLTTAQRYPSIACDTTQPFQFGVAPKRPNGDAVRCPNGDAALDGQCLLPVRADATQPGGVAFDCLNNASNVPPNGAVFDQDGNGSGYPDAPATDGRFDADGRAYNLVLRAADGSIRTANRPNPVALGTLANPVVGAFYRMHSSRSGLVPPNHTKSCAVADDATDQIGCLVTANLCSIGFAGGGAVTSNPGAIALSVNGVAPTTAAVQALISGGTAYPIARKLYVNSIRGFENLLDSSATVAGKDAELDMAQCYANLPFSTFGSVGGSAQVNVASAAFGFVPLPAPTIGGNAKAICEDFTDSACAGTAGNVDACSGNPAQVPSSACNNGYRDGDETAIDVCPAVRPTCTAGVCL